MSRNRELRLRIDDYHDEDGEVIKTFVGNYQPSDHDLKAAVELWCEANHDQLNYLMELDGAYKFGDGPWVPVWMEGRTEISFWTHVKREEPTND